jgi:hypothetical protein
MRLRHYPDFTGFPPSPEIKECMAYNLCSGEGWTWLNLEWMHNLDIPVLIMDKGKKGTKRLP